MVLPVAHIVTIINKFNHNEKKIIILTGFNVSLSEGVDFLWTFYFLTNVEQPFCQGYVPLTLDVMRVAFKVPLAFHTPL